MESIYQQLARRLDALPQGFPPTPNGDELELLEYLFTPEEAALAAQLSAEPEAATRIAARVGGDRREVMELLKQMSRRGLIRVRPIERGLGFALEPFVVGIYENQALRMDAKLAELFENYYRHGFGQMLEPDPKPHRVIPVNESVHSNVEVHPYENVREIVDRMASWGVQDCICRKQKALVGDPCDHPMEVCMAMSPQPGSFDNAQGFRALTKAEAFGVLEECARAGLVHSVSNTQEGVYYICNCCTCSCGFLRGIADLGMANVMARSAFVNQVDEGECVACGTCVDYCQFGALTLEEVIVVNETRCVGCGVCVPACPSGALSLRRRPEEEIKPVPVNDLEWGRERARARQIPFGEG